MSIFASRWAWTARDCLPLSGGEKASKAYKVIRTALTSRRVNFALDSLDDRSESIYLRGGACRGLLDLQVGSSSPKWKMDVTFQPQETLLGRLRGVTDRANRYAIDRR